MTKKWRLFLAAKADVGWRARAKNF